MERRYCPSCARPIAKDSRACPECGHRMGVSGVVSIGLALAATVLGLIAAFATGSHADGDALFWALALTPAAVIFAGWSLLRR